MSAHRLLICVFCTGDEPRPAEFAPGAFLRRRADLASPGRILQQVGHRRGERRRVVRWHDDAADICSRYSRFCPTASATTGRPATIRSSVFTEHFARLISVSS